MLLSHTQKRHLNAEVSVKERHPCTTCISWGFPQKSRRKEETTHPTKSKKSTPPPFEGVQKKRKLTSIYTASKEVKGVILSTMPSILGTILTFENSICREQYANLILLIFVGKWKGHCLEASSSSHLSSSSTQGGGGVRNEGRWAQHFLGVLSNPNNRGFLSIVAPEASEDEEEEAPETATKEVPADRGHQADVHKEGPDEVHLEGEDAGEAYMSTTLTTKASPRRPSFLF